MLKLLDTCIFCSMYFLTLLYAKTIIHIVFVKSWQPFCLAWFGARMLPARLLSRAIQTTDSLRCIEWLKYFDKWSLKERWMPSEISEWDRDRLYNLSEIGLYISRWRQVHWSLRKHHVISWNFTHNPTNTTTSGKWVIDWTLTWLSEATGYAEIHTYGPTRMPW